MFKVHALACWRRSSGRLALLAALGAICLGQAKQEDVKIIQPVVDKNLSRVTLPGAFWNMHEADWLDVAMCGRPSDFLHETVVCTTTTRTLLEKALRDIGCRDGDAWVDSVKDFPRIRGDRFMVLVEFDFEGKRQIFSLDELLEYQAWGISMGPFGFMFRGDPDRDQKPVTAPPASMPGIAPLPQTDATRILRDDPQIAIQFKGIQNVSQSLADHPLAYDDWEYEKINWSRNYAALPSRVYDSNGEIPVTLVFWKVGEEQLLTQSAKVWHDDAFRAEMLKQVPVAKLIDADKAEYIKLRDEAATLKKIPAELRDAEKELAVFGRLTVLAAEIEKNYAVLDAAWTTWAADHLKLETGDEKLGTLLKDQAKRWREHMTLEAERTGQLAIAEEAAFEKKKLLTNPDPATDAVARKQKAAALSGRELEARSRALIADNKQPTDHWTAEQKRLDPKTDPRDVWIRDVNLHVALCAAKDEAGKVGIALGQLLQSPTAPAADITKRNTEYEAAAKRVTLGELRLKLASVEFEISKREGFDDEPDLPALKKEREQIMQKIKQLETPTLLPSK